ncbi:PAS domain-containing protein [Arcticibacter svalbardensis]|nr:PAS domain-containing protein [Arcticibacter svalbardensis]
MSAIHAAFDLKATKDLLHNSKFYYIICTDNIGNYSYINNHYANRFNFIKSDFVGHPYYITMHPDDTKICEEVGKKCYDEPGKLFPATLRKHDGEGGYIVTQWEFTLMVENGEPTGVFCLGYDITEFTNAKNQVLTIEKALKNKKEKLNAIAFEQSHIVRAPLANIMGLVNIMKNMDLGPNLNSILSMLEESSNQLDKVIKGIIKKARP